MKEYTLGIESTAHTFSASVVSSDGGILSNAKNVYKAPEGSGIHPLEASQSHLKAASSVVGHALSESGVNMQDLSSVSYSMGPGLGPCLRVGGVVARTLAMHLNKP